MSYISSVSAYCSQIHKYVMFTFFSFLPISPIVPNMQLIEKKKRRCVTTWSALLNTETMWQPTS